VVSTSNGLHRLTTGGPVLGAFDKSVFDEETVNLGDGDTLILFSDGVTEACNIGGQEFGEHRLLSCLAEGGSELPSDTLNRILRSVKEFCQGTPQTDDMTIVVSRFHGHVESGYLPAAHSKLKLET